MIDNVQAWLDRIANAQTTEDIALIGKEGAGLMRGSDPSDVARITQALQDRAAEIRHRDRQATVNDFETKA